MSIYEIFKILLIIFISLTTSIKADLNKKLINQLNDGEKLIFIRHAYAPGNGDQIIQFKRLFYSKKFK